MPEPLDAYRIVQRALEQHGQAASPSLSIELDELFAEHRQMVLTLCRKMLGDDERALEVAQEAQLVAYTKLADFEPGTRFSTFVYGIARNLCRNARRKRADLLAEDGLIDPGDPSRPVLSGMLREEREALIRDAAAAVLEPLEQEAVHLRYVEGLSQQQITEILGLDGTGGRGLLQRCRRKLGREVRRRLEDMGHGASFLHSKM